MGNFDFVIEPFEEIIARIDKWTAAKPDPNLIPLNGDPGLRHLMAVEIEKGFFIRARNYMLRKEAKFPLTTTELNGQMFMISVLLTPDSMLIQTDYEWPARRKTIRKEKNVVLLSTVSGISFVVKAGAPVKAMDMCFSSSWLIQQVPLHKRASVQSLLSRWAGKSAVSFAGLSIENYKIVNDMVDKVNSREPELLFLKSRALMLINELIENEISAKEEKAVNVPANLATMVEIEKKIGSSPERPMPDLKTLAREYSLSESTLKRQFKKVYGKAIYEYHLCKKMELAKRIISNGELSVTQLAYTLGYEKVSSFIKVFKKEFGVSPGLLRKNKADLSANN
ncbi:MAG: AraC family transcriptional regulator [Chitinophagaceae bacterium]